MTDKARLISIVTPCYNEEENINELCRRISAVMAKLPYEYEHICIDNNSTDETVQHLKAMALEDKRLKIIINARNFGHIRSPHHGILQANGDAVILLAADLQDPPEMIPEFIAKWEAGYKTVMATKPESVESALMFRIRQIYYRTITNISEVPLIQNATGAGLYDRIVVEVLRQINDPYPYFRGLVCEIGFPIATVPFTQPRRKRGISKNNFYTLWDIGMLGFTNHSKVPLRLATFIGMGIGALSFFIGMAYLVYKLLFWDSFQVGTAPLVIGLFFIGAVQLFFLGIVGEYVGAIHTQVLRRPLVTERERINFD
jgi:glycosyltransferase involved in cell wall biosynthesis